MSNPLITAAICQLTATSALCNSIVVEHINSLTKEQIDELVTVAYTCHQAAEALGL